MEQEAKTVKPLKGCKALAFLASAVWWAVDILITTIVWSQIPLADSIASSNGVHLPTWISLAYVGSFIFVFVVWTFIQMIASVMLTALAFFGASAYQFITK